MVLQVALTVVLIAASGLLVKSFMRLKGVDVGFDTNNLLTASSTECLRTMSPGARRRSASA